MDIDYIKKFCRNYYKLGKKKKIVSINATKMEFTIKLGGCTAVFPFPKELTRELKLNLLGI